MALVVRPDAQPEAALLDIVDRFCSRFAARDADSGAREEKHPYRMSMVCEKREGRWLLVQVHGSSPHQG
jgi:hypothetical protein